MEIERLLDANDVARLLNVRLSRVYELTREHRLPFIKIGERQYRYSRLALNQWIEKGGSAFEKECEK